MESLWGQLRGRGKQRGPTPRGSGEQQEQQANAHSPPLHPDAHPDGGLACNNTQLLQQQREAIINWLKSVGKGVLAGNFSLLNQSFPVSIFEPRSFLEKIIDAWVYPELLLEASSSPPVRRMELVMAWFVAGLHLGFAGWRKPFNPILGETWQGSLPDGTTISLEQVSHHPPVSAFYMEGPGSSYRFVGQSEPSISLCLQHYGFKSTTSKGYRQFDFSQDGSTIKIHNPGFFMKGIVGSGKPRAEVDGTAMFVDEQHGLCGLLHFGADKAAAQPLLQRSDAVTGGIYDVSAEMKAKMPLPAAGHAAGAEDDSPRVLESLVESFLAQDQPLQQHQEQQQQQQQQHQQQDGFKPPSSSLPSKLSGLTKVLARVGSLGASAGASKTEQPPGKLLVHVEGNWLSHIDFGGRRQWTLGTEAPARWTPEPEECVLPSDSRFREDLRALRAGSLSEAQRVKEAMEGAQRRDKRLREVGRG